MKYDINKRNSLYLEEIQLYSYNGSKFYHYDNTSSFSNYCQNDSEPGKLKFENKNLRIKVLRDSGYIKHTCDNSVCVELFYKNSKKPIIINATVETLFSNVSKYGVDQNGFINNTFSLIQCKSYSTSQVFFKLIPSESFDLKVYKKKVKYSKLRGTTKWQIGHRYFNRTNYKEYIYLGKIDLFGDFYGWGKLNGQVRNFTETCCSYHDLFIEDKRDPIFEDLLKFSNNLTDYIYRLYEFDQIDHKDLSWYHDLSRVFYLIPANNKLNPMVDEGELLKDCEFNILDLKDKILNHQIDKFNKTGILSETLVSIILLYTNPGEKLKIPQKALDLISDYKKKNKESDGFGIFTELNYGNPGNKLLDFINYCNKGNII